ncbi:protein arginine N-methyltransferase [Martiniozyma asiatica (nom. inval.)]|nr:protein arginine N-methyltransferase [Martiniozyma asiatica]
MSFPLAIKRQKYESGDTKNQLCVYPLTSISYNEKINDMIIAGASTAPYLTVDDLQILPTDKLNNWIPILIVVGLEDAIFSFGAQKLDNEIDYLQYLGKHECILQIKEYSLKTVDYLVGIILKYSTMIFSITLDTGLYYTNLDARKEVSEWQLFQTIKHIIISKLEKNEKFLQNIHVFLNITKEVEEVDFSSWSMEMVRYIRLPSPPFSSDVSNLLINLHQIKSLQHPYFVLDDNDNLKFYQRSITELLQNAPLVITELAYDSQVKLAKVPSLDSILLNSKFVLQNPLEPTIKNLSNNTYSVFEEDSVKYIQYERAIMMALIDIQKEYTSKNSSHHFQVVIVGPGRGPLIDKFFNAVEHLSIPLNTFTIHAIERNAAVMPYLELKNNLKWKGKVVLYCQDIRNWEPPYTTIEINGDINNKRTNASAINYSRWPSSPIIDSKATFYGFDLVFSELIGSFGCNELMPEVLHPIVNFSRSKCRFVPQKVESYASPVYCPWLWNISLSDDPTCYVPIIPQYKQLCEPELMWSWDYQNLNKAKSWFLDRSLLMKRKFGESEITHNGVIHGIAGYFKSTLYPGIIVHNLPSMANKGKSKVSVSWLPFFMSLPKTSSFEVSSGDLINWGVERQWNDEGVWYEWSVKNPKNGNDGLVNVNGCNSLFKLY